MLEIKRFPHVMNPFIPILHCIDYLKLFNPEKMFIKPYFYILNALLTKYTKFKILI